MTPEPPHASAKNSPGIALKRLADALQERWQHIVHVIDDALHSECLKDRIWAVEQLLKRLKPDVSGPSSTVSSVLPNPQALRHLSDADLLDQLHSLLQTTSTSAPPQSLPSED